MSTELVPTIALDSNRIKYIENNSKIIKKMSIWQH